MLPRRAPRRSAVTLVELLFTVLMLVLVFLLAWYFFRSGRSVMESTRRKLDATQVAHIRFEYLRHDLEAAPWVWAEPVNEAMEKRSEEKKKDPLGGGRYLLAGQREYLYDPVARRLIVNTEELPDSYEDVRFHRYPEFLVKFLVTCDRSTGRARTGKPAHRERSTLVSKAFVEPEAEEVRERRHVWEGTHGWCVRGGSIHFGITD